MVIPDPATGAGAARTARSRTADDPIAEAAISSTRRTGRTSAADRRILDEARPQFRKSTSSIMKTNRNSTATAPNIDDDEVIAKNSAPSRRTVRPH